MHDFSTEIHIKREFGELNIFVKLISNKVVCI